MKPVGKYANNVVMDLMDRIAARKGQERPKAPGHPENWSMFRGSVAKLDAKETAEEAEARAERQRQRLHLLDRLRDVMSTTLAVLGENDGKFAIELALGDALKHNKFKLMTADDTATEF